MAKITSTTTSIKVIEKSNTPLAVLAAGMQPGEWKKMTPTPAGILNFVGEPPAYTDGGHSNIKTGYADKMAYDPKNKLMYFLGCDHAQVGTFIKYDEATNVFSSITPAYPWSAPTHHGYNHTTFDTKQGVLYHRPYADKAVHKYVSGSWTRIGYESVIGYTSAANGCEYFPDLGPNGHIMVYQNENGTNGVLVGLDPVTGVWTTYVNQATGILSGSGDPHNVAFYSPIHKVVWFGGGNGSNSMWKISATGTVTKCENIPGPIGQIGCSPGQSLAVNNPVNGNFLVYKSSSVWYEYNPSTNIWTPKSGIAQVFNGNMNYMPDGPVWGVVATPIHQYGVIVFVKGINRTSAEMWVYKPSA